jgi:hypothetical protein
MQYSPDMPLLFHTILLILKSTCQFIIFQFPTIINPYPIGMGKAAKRAGHSFGSIPARSFFNGSTSIVVLQSAANPRGFPV